MSVKKRGPRQKNMAWNPSYQFEALEAFPNKRAHANVFGNDVSLHLLSRDENFQFSN